MSDAESGGPSSGALRDAEAAFDAANAGEKQLPAIDFPTFVLSLHHSARVHMGDAPDPADGKTELDLSMARQTIDLIALLQDKTRGNLTGEEERIVEQALYDLRMRYVEVAKSK
jgi:hypothetical protein